MRWDSEGDTEENSTKVSEENVICSKCTRSIDPIVDPIMIDVTPSSPIITPLSPMDTTPGTTGKETNGEGRDKDNGKDETQVCWKDCVENIVELDRESMKYGNYLTDAIL